jgi:phosphoglycerol transferase MdoB-like AlkP superfamily enzyme
LGFETFKGINEFDYTDVSGIYIDDMACVKQIIKEFENKTSERIFEFVVTMENHGTYKTPRYKKFDFEMEGEKLTEEDYADLQRYSQGVYNADKAFMALVDYFKNVDEPVMIAMYGDHLPLLGISGSTYIDGGMVENGDESALPRSSISRTLSEPPVSSAIISSS